MAGLIALTFDTDHMSESRMDAFLKAFSWPGRAVIFCTQRYACTSEADHELAPHPYLPEGGDWDGELKLKREMFPNAVGWRSHSCVYSQMLALRLAREGFLYASTDEAWGHIGLVPSPSCWGLIQMPIYYMDTCDISRTLFWPTANHQPFDVALIDRALSLDGLFVLDFHPVHLMLNTPDVEYYLTRRQAFIDGAPLGELVHPGRGIATFFNELCSAMRAQGGVSTALGSLARQHRSTDLLSSLPPQRASVDARVHKE